MSRDVVLFIGVSTASSSIVRIFPGWARELGLRAEVVGVDLPLGAGRERYRRTLARMIGDPGIRGAVITTHKANLFEHAEDMFTDLDPYARLCREVSCVAIRPGRVFGWAKDPVTARLALEPMVGSGWRMRGEALCLGAGGAGLAVSVALLGMSPGPPRMTLVDRVASRLELARAVHEELGSAPRLACRTVTELGQADDLVSRLPPGSLVINATGMGKDLPGSPVSARARFPRRSIVWDLNYRGELGFLQLARAQQERSDLRVVDGWRYFLHGWTEAVAELFAIHMTPRRFERLASLADARER